MYEIKSIIRPERVASVVPALHDIPDLPGVTVSVVRGFGRRASAVPAAGVECGETEMAKLEIVVSEPLVQTVVDTLQEMAATGRPGDGKVFISRVDEAIKIRSGTRGSDALR